MATHLAEASAWRRQNRAAADSAHFLLRRLELSEAPEGGRRQARRSASGAGQTRDRLSRPECADRTRRGCGDPVLCDGQDPLRRRDRRGYRQEGQASHQAECDGLRVRLHHRQRRQRTKLAEAARSLWRSKNADTFKPMGPWIETEADLDKMETIVRVN